MSLDAAEADRRVAAAEAGLAEREVGSDGYRAALVGLAAALAARYVHGGPAADGLRAEQIARDVLADSAATDDQRQTMSMLLPTLAMVRLTPAAALRDHTPDLDAETLRRTEGWRAGTDDQALATGLEQVLGQLAAIEDTASLPPQIRSALAMMSAATGLMSDVSRPEWSGTVAPDVVVQLRDAVAVAAPETPGRDLLHGLVVWVDGVDRSDERGARVAELEAAITDLPENALLTPVLRAELAVEIVRAADLGGPGSGGRTAALLQQAVDGMAEDHPCHAETVRMLAGALVATAAESAVVADRERAVQVAAQVVAAGADGPERRFLSSLVAMLPGGDHDARGALHDLVVCVEQLPAGHPLRPVALGQFGAVLADRSLVAGLFEDGSDAVALLARAIAAAGPGGDSGAMLATVAGIVGVNAALRRGDATGLEQAAAGLRLAQDRMPATHPLRPNATLVLAVADLRVAAAAGTGLREALAAVRSAAGEQPAGLPPSTSRTLVTAIDSLAGLLDDDPAAVLAAAQRMEAALAAPGSPVHPLERPAQLLLLGKALLAAIGSGEAPDGTARRAVEHLTEARSLLGPDAGVPMAGVLPDLASALRAAGEHARARLVAVEALEHHASTVLLQSNTTDAVLAAQGASVDATQLARWCLADGDLAGAVAAVELGRGLVLHATTSVSWVIDVLADVGRADLAELWRAERPGVDSGAAWAVEAARGEMAPERASDIRSAAGMRGEVVATLRATPQGRGLFRAPSARDVGEALRTVGADALAYLVPGGPGTPGRLLVVDSSGGVVAVDAPQLRDTPTGPLATYLAVPAPHSDGFVPATWRAALGALCDWAGEAVLGPLLGALPGRRAGGPASAHRVVLVPCDRLGSVPWAAARRTGPSGPRHACEDLVLSSGASARQLIDVAARPAATAGAVLVSGSAEFGRREVQALRAGVYPNATVLGPVVGADAPGTPQDLLDRLPGSGRPSPAVVHLACHAVASDDPGRTFIVLTEELTIADVLRQGTARDRGEPGPTVVLAACETDLARGSADEALTLATAFLTAGAVGVVGSLWRTRDRYASVLMVVFHHFHGSLGLPAAEALRRMQLWALDPDRPAIGGLEHLGSGFGRDPARLPMLSAVEMWAVFTHHGR